MTATPPPLIVDHAEPPPGTWEREASHFPEPITPFTKTLLRTEEWGRQITAEIGSLIDTTRFIEVGGWVYTRVVPIGDRPGAPPPPSWLVPLLFRVVPQIRRRMRTAQAAHDTNWSGRQIELWHEAWRDELSTRLAALRAVELEGFDDRALDEHLLSAIALSHHSLPVHFRLHAAIALELRGFTRCCSDLLGWDGERSLAMLTGTSTTSTQAGRALSDLARTARRSPLLLELIGHAPVDQVLAADADFATEFEDYQDRYCFRALTYDLSDPTLAERPELVLNLVRDQLRGADRPAAGDGRPLIARARALLAAAPVADQSRFDEALERGRRAYPVREDNVYLTVSAPFALVRTSALEIGRRLADRGRLADGDDVFLLEVDQARSALLDGSDARDIVDRHREQRLHTLANPGPDRFGPAPTIPSWRGLPATARRQAEDAMWLMEALVPRPRPQAGGTVLTGVPGAPGRASGPVRVIANESEFDKLQAGDVLVCPCTSPAWSIVFPSLAAIVTDSGGILSHPAIVAREFGIPAVVATADATTRLTDGQLVVVDGSDGTVRVNP